MTMVKLRLVCASFSQHQRASGSMLSRESVGMFALNLIKAANSEGRPTLRKRSMWSSGGTRRKQILAVGTLAFDWIIHFSCTPSANLFSDVGKCFIFILHEDLIFTILVNAVLHMIQEHLHTMIDSFEKILGVKTTHRIKPPQPTGAMNIINARFKGMRNTISIHFFFQRFSQTHCPWAMERSQLFNTFLSEATNTFAMRTTNIMGGVNRMISIPDVSTTQDFSIRCMST